MATLEDVLVKLTKLETQLEERKTSTEIALAIVRTDAHEFQTDVLKKVGDLTKDVREVRDTMIMTKGGWKVLVALGGLAMVIGAFLAKLPWDRITKWFS